MEGEEFTPIGATDWPGPGAWPCHHEPPAVLPPRLHALLYRLMRNDMATGAMEGHLIEVGRHDQHEPIDFTNPHLAALAAAHAGFLLDGFTLLEVDDELVERVRGRMPEPAASDFNEALRSLLDEIDDSYP